MQGSYAFARTSVWSSGCECDRLCAVAAYGRASGSGTSILCMRWRGCRGVLVVKLAAVGSRRGLWATGIFAGLTFLCRRALEFVRIWCGRGVWGVSRSQLSTPIPSPIQGRGASGSLALPNSGAQCRPTRARPNMAERRGARLVGFLSCNPVLLIASAVIILLWL